MISDKNMWRPVRASYDNVWRHVHSNFIDFIKQLGFPIAVVNGVFDVLHRGHLNVFETAANLRVNQKPTCVVALLNSDASVKRIKGSDRPFVLLEDRLAVVASLRYVRFAVGFSEDTPVDIIASIRPDFLVKGAEYEGTNIPGAEYAGAVIFAPMMHNTHTTDIIAKINNRG